MTEADELLRLVRVAAAAADDKKADETLIVDVGDVFAVSDYFVITSGS
ncbi:MAG: ribosome silencing factor, partial [Actinobacteria bacterium]|nr:ribosome silencing factor [Actinomycetota bacterium]